MSGLRRAARVPCVEDFYAGRSVLLTGAAGYLGSILLEILLRCCPGIKWLYILLRAKKGVQPEDRKELIFQKEIFAKLKEKLPEVLKKVRVVSGDITQVDLGLSPEDLVAVREDVSVVFHCAANISFVKPLRYMLLHNLVGTGNVIDLCRKLKQLKALVYTSTAYSNSNRLGEPIVETVYQHSVQASYLRDQVNRKEVCDEMLASLVSKCGPKWPNFYVFSKSMAENLLQEKAPDLPVVIIRPSVITCCWKGVLPGYVEEGTGMVDISIGIGKGFIRVLRCDPEKKIDHVPVDVVANAHVVSAWSIATSSWTSTPLVINCTSGEVSPCTWHHYTYTLLKLADTHSLPRTYRKPSIVLRKGAVSYWISAFLDHYAPAYVFDFLLRVYRKKPRLVKLYAYFEKAMEALKYFTLNDWEMRSDNFRQMGQELETKEAETFYLDLREYSIDELCKHIPYGAPFLYNEENGKTRKEREKIIHRRFLLTQFIKWFLIIGFVFVVFGVVMNFIIPLVILDI